MIYLDNAATTYPKPECVYKALDNANRNAFNAGRGSYSVAREANKRIDNVREKVLKLNNINNAKVVFTSSATESLNDLIFGINYSSGDNIYISPFEHNSVIRPLEEIKNKFNVNIIVLPFKKDTWEIDKEKLHNMFIINKPKVVIVSHVSNVTGFLLPYKLIFEESMVYNSINILDSSQGYGIINIEGYDNINYLVFAGHKSLYSSFGIAGYIKFKNDILGHNIFGGTGSDTLNPNMLNTFPDGYEAGSHNIVAIDGLSASIDWLLYTDVFNHEKQITKYLIEQLLKLDNCELYLPKDLEKCFGIVSINVKGYSSSDVGEILGSEFNICVRTGYHCAPLVHELLDTKKYGGCVRISVNYFTSESDIDCLINALKTL